ncbi:MAG: glycosyltransferase family 2 protein [Saprospiraceae bacterium]
MNTPSKILTIIICTYKRNDILKHCIRALLDQSAGIEKFNVLIVNNCDDEKVHFEILEMIKSHDHITVIKEPNLGLSIARNTGVKTAKAQWVTYIDDDCKVAIDFVSTTLSIIDGQNYECFGGHITSWWLYDKPRWMKQSFGSKPIISDKEIDLLEEYNWGGNITFKKEALLNVGGFDEKIGMKGKRIGYSAENRVQIKLREKGFRIGYNPNLKVAHLVASHKMKLWWHIRAAYAEGRDAKTVFPEQYTYKAHTKDALRILKTLGKSIFLWISKTDYYWENVIKDVFYAKSKFLGKLSTYFTTTDSLTPNSPTPRLLTPDS